MPTESQPDEAFGAIPTAEAAVVSSHLVLDNDTLAESVGDGLTVQTVGDRHTLYGPDLKPVKVWTGDDADHASVYTNYDDGSFSVLDPDRTVTDFNAEGRAQHAVLADGTEVDFRSDGSTVQTVGDQHTLSGVDHRPVKVWTGDDADHASLYSYHQDGSFSVLDPDRTVTDFNAEGRAQHAVLADGTEVDFRSDGSTVQTVGDQHTLFGADQKAVSTWSGDDAERASSYSHHGDDSFSIVDPDRTVTEFDAAGRAEHAVLADGTEVDFRSDGSTVRTVGDQHTLFGPDQRVVKSWSGDDVGHASVYSHHRDGSFSVRDADRSVTEFDAKGRPEHAVLADGTEVDFRSDGSTVRTVGDQHTLFGADQRVVKSWSGDDVEHATRYTNHGDTSDHGNAHAPVGSGGQTVERVTHAPADPSFVGVAVEAPLALAPNVVQRGVEGSHPQGGSQPYRVDVAQYVPQPAVVTPFHSEIGSVTGILSSQKAPDGTAHPVDGEPTVISEPGQPLITLEYRNDGTVQTQGDVQTLYGPDKKPIKVWTGGDESKAVTYGDVGGGQYTLTDPGGKVTTYDSQNRPILVSEPGKQDISIEYREGNQSVQTVGDVHTLYGPDNKPIKIWTGADESKAATYRDVGGGQYTLTDPGGKVTTYDSQNRPILVSEPGKQDISIEYREDGSIQTQGDVHTLYDLKGRPVKRWTGNDTSRAETWTYNKDNTITKRDPNGTETLFGPDGSSITTTIPNPNGGEPTVIHWEADLDALHDAIGEVGNLHKKIRDENHALKKKLDAILLAWHSPSGESFAVLSASFREVADTLSMLLGEAVRRMQSSYDAYVATEAANKAALTPQ